MADSRLTFEHFAEELGERFLILLFVLWKELFECLEAGLGELLLMLSYLVPHRLRLIALLGLWSSIRLRVRFRFHR